MYCKFMWRGIPGYNIIIMCIKFNKYRGEQGIKKEDGYTHMLLSPKK